MNARNKKEMLLWDRNGRGKIWCRDICESRWYLVDEPSWEDHCYYITTDENAEKRMKKLDKKIGE